MSGLVFYSLCVASLALVAAAYWYWSKYIRRYRVVLELTWFEYSRIRYLAIESGVSVLNVAEIVRRALLLLDLACQYREAGYRLQMKGPNGEVVEVPELIANKDQVVQ